MTIHELLSHDFTDKTIVIIGAPASGKTFAASLLFGKLSTHQLVNTDLYKDHGFEQSLYALRDALAESEYPKIIEGVLGYRLLRKGAEMGDFYPDVVVEMQVPDEVIERQYEQRGPEKLKGARTMMKANATVLSKYMEMVPIERKPIWIIVNNEY